MKNLLAKVKKKIFKEREEDDTKYIIIVDSDQYADLNDNDKAITMSSNIFREYKISNYKYYDMNDYLTIKSLKGKDSGIKNSLYPLNIFNDINEQEDKVAVIELDFNKDNLLYEFLSSDISKMYDIEMSITPETYCTGKVQAALAKLKYRVNVAYD